MRENQGRPHRAVPYEHNSNARAERAIRTIMAKTRSLLQYAGMKSSHWWAAARQAAYLNNVTPRQYHNELVWENPSQEEEGGYIEGSKWSSPYALTYGRHPDVSHVRIFGCFGYAVIQKEEREAKKLGKLANVSHRGIYCGYAEKAERMVPLLSNRNG